MKRSKLIQIIKEEIQNVLKEESTQYNVEGLLLTNTIDRPQKDILSDIRSLPGVTIVSSKDSKIREDGLLSIGFIADSAALSG